MSNNGILFIATGERYLLGANEAAKSIRSIMGKNILIDIFCDDPKWLDKTLYDRIEIVDDPHRRSKIDCLPLTRFDRTLYLDTDIKIVEDIGHMFELLDKFDLALAHAHSRNRDFTLQTWRKPIAAAFPQYNGGVILYKSSEKRVLDFMRNWQSAFHSAGFQKDQTTLRELLWDTDLRLHTLPPEYNIRYEKYLTSWSKTEAAPKILHFQRFKDDIVTSNPGNDSYEPEPRNLGYKIKKFLARTKQQILGTTRPNKTSKSKQKIFGLGFHKTGTSSMGKALSILGYKTIHGDGRKSWAKADEGVTLTKLIDSGETYLPTFDLFDAFLDNPYFNMWRKLADRENCKFILTIRDPEQWIDSCMRFYKDRRVRHMRQWMFGEFADPTASSEARQAWLDAYNKHNSEIMEHFKGRDDLLIIDVTKNTGWNELCEFLGKPVPKIPFPHANKTKPDT